MCKYREGQKQCTWWDPKQNICLNPNPEIVPDASCQEVVEKAKESGR
jgi:hypothetical protein